MQLLGHPEITFAKVLSSKKITGSYNNSHVFYAFIYAFIPVNSK